MARVMQGDAYSIPVTIKAGNGTLITPEIAACVEITVGQYTKRWPGQVTFGKKMGEWKFPVTQGQTFRFTPGIAAVQARVVFQDGSIMGGSGAPIRVERSASRGVLPQPESTTAESGSAPKSAEVTIPTVHDINVSLHSQVILSDPVKAPYIGDNGNWYEYDAATGEFVDTGVKAGGSALPSGGTAGQILAKKSNQDGDTEWEDPQKAVLYDQAQALTDDQKQQARENIGAGTSNFSGNYNDLNNKPEQYTLPVASENQLGGVKPVSKTDDMTQDVGVDEQGRLHTAPGSGGTDPSLGITGASVGQVAKITEVDSDGKPTAWEGANAGIDPSDTVDGTLVEPIVGTVLDITPLPAPATATVGQIVKVKAVDAEGNITATEAVDMPSGDEWEHIGTVTASEDVMRLLLTVDNDGNPYALKKFRMVGKLCGNSGSYTGWIRVFNDVRQLTDTVLSGFEAAEDSYCSFDVVGEIVCGIPRINLILRSTNATSVKDLLSPPSGSGSYWYQYAAREDAVQLQSYTALGISGYQAAIGAGTTFELYGVRA